MAFSPHSNDVLPPPCSPDGPNDRRRPRGVYESEDAIDGCRSFQFVAADGRTFATFCVQDRRIPGPDFLDRLWAALDYYDRPLAAVPQEDDRTATVLPIRRVS